MAGTKFWAGLALLLSIILPVIFLWVQANWLQVSRYTIVAEKIPPAFNGFKIVHLSDLHSRLFGRDSAELLAAIRAQEPHIVVATGDMLNARHDGGQVFVHLARQLGRRIPLYYVSGNHELRASQGLGFDQPVATPYGRYVSRLLAAGVIMLDNTALCLTADGRPAAAPPEKGGNGVGQHRCFERGFLRLTGLNLPLKWYSWTRLSAQRKAKPLDVAELQRYVPSPTAGEFTLLLAHNPKYFNAYVRWGADLILAGHVHGGVIRLPFVGGLLAPERTLFPKYDAGEFVQGKAKMIVSRGLGSAGPNLRVFNRPQLVTVELRHQPRRPASERR